MLLYLLIIPLSYLPIKFILHLLTIHFGKISYDESKNIFYTDKNAWQKEFGYCHLYDVYAPVFRMIIDTEPIKFHYDNKNYLICFWKGQYGMVTGGEIGTYYTNQTIVNKKTLYIPLEDKDLLDISFTLSKKGKKNS